MKIKGNILKWIATAVILCSVTIGEVSAQLNKSYFYTKGREYILDGRYREAIESLNILLRSQTKEYEGYFLRGVAKYNLNDLHGSMRDFSLVLELNPVYTLAYQYRGIVRSRLAMYDDALADFQRAITMRPAFSGAYYSRAVTLFLNQQFEGAIKDYDTFLALEPLNVDGYVNRGTAKLYAQDTVAAMADFNRAIEVNPYSDNGYLRRGVLYMVQGDIDKGIEDMDSALAIDSTTAIGYFYRASCYNNKGNISMALNDFDKAISYDPTNSVAIYNRAILRSQIGDYNRAIEDYNLVVAQNPQNVLVYYNRASVYARLGNLQAAIDDYTKAIEIYGDFANAYLFRSNLKAALGDKKGYYSDKAKAEKLVSEYHKTFEREGETAFADTSSRFNDIISFNADFENENMNRLSSKVLNKYQPMGMYRVTMIAEQDSVDNSYDYREYQNEEMDRLLEGMGINDVVLSNRATNVPNWALAEIEMKYSQESQMGADRNEERDNEIFVLGVVNTLMRQFSMAMDYYSFLISSGSDNALVYLNRAVTEAEMTEFMASLQGDYQNVAVQDNPVERLKATKTKKEYDFDKVFEDLYSAAQLMPELPYVHYNLGYMYTVKGDLPLAVESYTRAIELYPYFAEAYYNRGLVQLKLDEREKGALDLSRAGEIGLQQAYKVIDEISIK